MREEEARELGTAPIARLLWRFALPSIIGMVVSGLYNVVDRIFIGRGVGSLALAGVTVSFGLQLVQIAFAVLVGVGASALISISLGEGNKHKAEQVLGNGFGLSLLISSAMAGLGLLFLDPLLRVFGASEAVLPYAREFSRIILIATPLSTIAMGLNSFIRAEGNPRVAMITQLIGPALNVVLCPIFIFGLGLGIAGSALATVLSQAVGSVWVLHYYLSGRSLLRLRLRALLPSRALSLSILALGSATALTELSAAFLTGVLNNQLQRYGGDAAVSAMGIIFAVWSLVFLTLIGMTMGVQPLLGYNHGARLFGRVRQLLLSAIGAATLFLVLCFACIQLFPEAFVALFAGDQAEAATQGWRELAVVGMHYTFLTLPLLGAQVLGAGFFQATGKPLQSVLLSLSRQLLLLIPLMYVLPLFLGLDGVWLAQPAAEVLATVITAVFLLRELRRLAHQPA